MSVVELVETIDLSKYVNVDMDQIVNGVKTFNNSPIVPDPITSQQVTNKGYVDSNLLLKVNKTSKIISGKGIMEQLNFDFARTTEEAPKTEQQPLNSQIDELNKLNSLMVAARLS